MVQKCNQKNPDKQTNKQTEKNCLRAKDEHR